MLALPAKTLAAGFLPSSGALFLCWVYMAASGLLIAEVNVNTLYVAPQHTAAPPRRSTPPRRPRRRTAAAHHTPLHALPLPHAPVSPPTLQVLPRAGRGLDHLDGGGDHR